MQAFNLPHGLGIRPSRPADEPFLERLYQSTRNDLQMVDAEQGFIDVLIEQQQHAQEVGYGATHPNAMYFIIEKLDESIGRVVIDFGSNEVHMLDIAFIEVARGKGFGEGVIQALQYAAAASKAPMTLSVNPMNFHAKRLYLKLGFQVEVSTPTSERMIWYPTNQALRA